MEPKTHLIPETLASNDSDFIADTLVGLEVQSQFWIITFDYDFGGFLDGLRANATLCCSKTSAHLNFTDVYSRLWSAYHLDSDLYVSSESKSW